MNAIHRSPATAWLDHGTRCDCRGLRASLTPAGLDGYEPCAADLRVELVTDPAHFLPEECPRLVAETAVSLFSALMDPKSGDTASQVPAEAPGAE
jgi:hypothetical protein